MTRMTPVSKCVAPALCAALLAAGCAEHEAPQRVATRVIKPGEQQLTVPSVPAAAAPAAEPAPAASEATTVQGSTDAIAPDADAEASAAAEPAAAATTSTPAATTSGETTGTEFAALRGRVTVTGSVSALPPLKSAGDPGVKDAICVKNSIPDESVIVSADGGLADVFVYAKKLPAGVKPPPPPTEPAVLDQQGCRFVPQAMVFRAGQPLLMKNTDPVAHNVRTAALAMPINQIITPSNTTGIPVTYKGPERMPVQTRCDIHAWMLGWHFPLDHPYAAVTGPDGSFEIKDLPAGDWEFVIWHGRAGYVERSYKFKAAAGQVVSHDVSVPAAKLSQ
jgi:hypothetical protein